MKTIYMNFFKGRTMKNGCIILVLALFSTVELSAQNANQERLNAYKIAFFTQRLGLSSKDAEKFWPLYNEYQEKKNIIQQERALLTRKFNLNGDTMTDDELSKQGDRYIELEVEEAALSKEFHNKVKVILPPRKILKLYQAENQYKLQLLKELQDRQPVRNQQIR